jgi:hypothetical protein
MLLVNVALRSEPRSIYFLNQLSEHISSEAHAAKFKEHNLLLVTWSFLLDRLVYQPYCLLLRGKHQGEIRDTVYNCRTFHLF